jgi:ABC-2 type transport system ATP-binding protein
MRQRLGLAHAVLGDPSVLVLDEPANGLDPEGIYWMRFVLRQFADAGGTVLLSSHLLREVEAVADRMVLISSGRVVAQGTLGELVASSGVRVRATDPPALRAALAAAGIDAQPGTNGTLLARAEAEQVGRAAASAGVVLVELGPADEDGLEQLFLSLTNGNDQARNGTGHGTDDEKGA